MRRYDKAFSVIQEQPSLEIDLSLSLSVCLSVCLSNMHTFSGTSFSGYRSEPVIDPESGGKIFFGGGYQLEAIYGMLTRRNSFGMNNASDVVVSGSSAGGLAVFLHIDFIANLIRYHQIRGNKPKIVGVPDAGYFMDLPAIEPDHKDGSLYRYSNLYKAIFNFSDASKTVNRGCLDHFDKDDQGNCFFAQYTLPFIETPIFIVNSLNDAWQQQAIMRLNCKPYHGKRGDCGNTAVKYINNFAKHMRKSVELHLPKYSGAWLNQCSLHTQVNHQDSWMQMSVDGFTLREAFYAWYNNPIGEHVLNMDGDVGSNSCAE